MASGEDQQLFCLKWNNFDAKITSSFQNLRNEGSFLDVTLASEGKSCKAHKMVLSACSPYFKALIESTTSTHPIIILKDVPFDHLQLILDYMYVGKITIHPDFFSAFLKTAHKLKVKGLVEVKPNSPIFE